MAPLPDVRILESAPLGPFSWRWPEGAEQFDRGWSALVEVDGVEVHIRHGLNLRQVFGRSRAHSVTWVENDPTVEGVGEDHYEQTRALLSLIKVTKKHLRPDDPLPQGYEHFDVVVMADAATGPHSPRSLAVRIREEDIDNWVRHAVLRAAAWGSLRSVTSRKDRTSLPPRTSSGPAPATVTDTKPGEHQAVVKALLDYAATQPKPEPDTAVEFTPVPAANELLWDDLPDRSRREWLAVLPTLLAQLPVEAIKLGGSQPGQWHLAERRPDIGLLLPIGERVNPRVRPQLSGVATLAQMSPHRASREAGCYRPSAADPGQTVARSSSAVVDFGGAAGKTGPDLGISS